MLAFALGAGCKRGDQNTQKPPPPTKKRVVIGLSQEPDTLFLPFKAMRASEMVARTGAYTLTVYDENWDTVPWAATELPTPDNGGVVMLGERMQVTWHLRSELAWPDGTPLTADDFVFGFKVQQHPQLQVLDRTVVDNVEKMEAMGADRRTLVVTFKQPYAYYDAYDQHMALPRHLLADELEKDPAGFERLAFGQTPALASSFTIESWVPGGHVRAVKNPAVKPPFAPILDEVVWRFIPETNALESNLISGTIDAIGPLGITFDMAVELEQRHQDKVDVHYTPSLKWEHVAFNTKTPGLDDVRVRRALALAIDREKISRELFEGKQPVAHGTEPERSPYFAKDAPRYAHDPARARQLLDEAGWSLGPKGVRQKTDASGSHQLSFELSTTAGDRLREQVQVLLVDAWKKIGVEVKINNHLGRVFFADIVRRRNFEGMVMFSWQGNPRVPRGNVWRCDRIPEEANAWQGQNITAWCNEEATALLDQASVTLDEAERNRLMQRFEHIFAQELPALPLWFRVEVTVTRKGLSGWRPTGTFQSVGWNAHEWSWKDGPQPSKSLRAR